MMNTKELSRPALPRSTYESAAERVDDPGEIAEVLAFLARERVPGVMRTKLGPKSAYLGAVDVETATLRWSAASDDWTASTSVSFVCQHCAYQVPLTSTAGQRGTSAIPTWITKSSRRGARRVRPSTAVSLVFQHPLSWTSSVEHRVHDLSYTGLCFEVESLEHMLYPGLDLPVFELRSQGTGHGRYRGRVRYCRAAGRGFTVGVALEPLSTSDGVRLERLLERALYPHTLGSGEDVWRVFETSGYLDLSGKRPADFQHLREPFLQVAKKLTQAADVGIVGRWPATGAAQATVSHLKTYQSSWFLCQVSKLKGAPPESRLGLCEIYLRIHEKARLDEDTRWLLVYVQDDAPRWSRELHLRLPQRYAASGEACAIPFRAFECKVAPRIPVPTDVGVRVAVTDPATARAAMRDMHRVRPAQYLDALDLTESRFDLASARARWNAVGLERNRQIWVAYEGTQRCALAVAEVAEQGAHLYGLLDCLRMYPLRPHGERAFPALLESAQGWFAEQGRQSFSYLEEYPDTLPLESLGFYDMGGATFTILSIDRMPELLQRTADLASQRPPALRAADRGRASRLPSHAKGKRARQ